MNMPIHRAGDHIRVEFFPGLCHEAIYVSDRAVIEHAKPRDGGRVRCVSYAKFARGRRTQTVHYDDADPSWVVIARASRSIGTGQYDVVSSNCEHFARWCKTGRKESKQVKNVIGLTVGLLMVSSIVKG